MKKSSLSILICFAMSASVAVLGTAQDPKAKDSAQPEFKVGQMWSYKTRSGEEKSYFIIVKLDDDPKLGRIIHIAVRGLRMKNPRSLDGISENVNHLPFSAEAVNKSVTKLLKEKTDLPEFEEGYEEWRDAFNAGHAGIYTITVAEVVRVLEVSLNQ